MWGRDSVVSTVVGDSLCVCVWISYLTYLAAIWPISHLFHIDNCSLYVYPCIYCT